MRRLKLETVNLRYLNGSIKTISNQILINASLLKSVKSQDEIRTRETYITTINRVKLLDTHTEG